MTTLLLYIPRVQSHIALSEPVPINAPKNPYSTYQNADYDYSSPLSPSGSDFPCKGYHTTVPEPIANYTAGDTYTASFLGSATHSGGSCQFALSYDKGATFHVIKSVIGGCPLKDLYAFRIPEEVPNGDEVLFSWTWVNREGNREFYMDCAWITIKGSSTKDEDASKALFNLPGLYVANIEAINECVTIEQEDVVYAADDRGPDVEYGDGLSEESPVTAGKECTWNGKQGDKDSAQDSNPMSGHGPGENDSGHDHTDDNDHDHEQQPMNQPSAEVRPMIMAPGAAQGPALPVPSPKAQGQLKPVPVGNPHPIALAGYDLMYAPASESPQDDDVTVTVHATESCTDLSDAVYVTMTATCTSGPDDVVVTVTGNTITIRPTSMSMSINTRSSKQSPMASSPRPSRSSTWLTIPSSRPSSRPPQDGAGLQYGSSSTLSQFLPCVPGTFLCSSATEFWTCDQTRLEGGGYGWTWLYPRPVAKRMMCKPKLVGGVGKGQMSAVPEGWHREDEYVREGS